VAGGIKAAGLLPGRIVILVLVAVATVAVVVVGAVLLFVNHAPGSTPDQTLTTFCNAVNSGDGQTAYNQLSTAAMSRVSEAQFASNLHALTSQSPIINCTYKNVQQNGSTATATMFIGPEDPANLGLPPSAPVRLVNENNVWKIDNGGNLQFSH
jgi:hypothetical protein